jgi:hypothetical protein
MNMIETIARDKICLRTKIIVYRLQEERFATIVRAGQDRPVGVSSVSEECFNGWIKFYVVTLYRTVLYRAVPIAFSVDVLVRAELAPLGGCVEFLKGIRASGVGTVGIIPNLCRWLEAEGVHG